MIIPSIAFLTGNWLFQTKKISYHHHWIWFNVSAINIYTNDWHFHVFYTNYFPSSSRHQYEEYQYDVRWHFRLPHQVICFCQYLLPHHTLGDHKYLLSCEISNKIPWTNHDNAYCRILHSTSYYWETLFKDVVVMAWVVHAWQKAVGKNYPTCIRLQRISEYVTPSLHFCNGNTSGLSGEL